MANIRFFLQKNELTSHRLKPCGFYTLLDKASDITQAFTVELFDFIEEYSDIINYWIYGHHHFNTEEFKIGNTTLLTNQLGYVRSGENDLFKMDAIIEV
jgi:hypothetical protein